MRKKLTVGVATFVAVLALTSAPAYAYHCFVANRSATGTAQSGTHSNVWAVVTLDEFLQEEMGLSPACASGAVAAVAGAGLPTQFSTHTGKTIGEGSANPNFGNGKGLELLELSPVSNASIGAALGFVEANPVLCS